MSVLTKTRLCRIVPDVERHVGAEIAAGLFPLAVWVERPHAVRAVPRQSAVAPLWGRVRKFDLAFKCSPFTQRASLLHNTLHPIGGQSEAG
jgi:hypothetical protein